MRLDHGCHLTHGSPVNSSGKVYRVGSYGVTPAGAASRGGAQGMGPAASTWVPEQRRNGDFDEWNDCNQRVKGLAEGNAANVSNEGLTVNGTAFKGVTAAPTTKKETKPAAKADEKKIDAKNATGTAPAAAAPTAKEEKKDPKAEAKAKKEAEKQAKAEEKQKKADEAKAKKDVKAEAPKAAASAAKK